MAKLYFSYSTMNAGKSTLLLQASYNYRERGMRTLLFTSALYAEAGKGVITSRIGISAEAETFTAEDACRWGLVEAVYPADELDLAVDALVTALVEPEPRAVRLQKQLMQRWEELPMSAAVDAGVDAFEDAFRTDAPARAMADFLARRRAAKSGT